MPLREITAAETDRLRECLVQLSVHHNEVSSHFGGCYPSRPYEETLRLFADSLARGASRIAVMEEEGRIAGFCRVDIPGDGSGCLSHLVALPHCRGRGWGARLMDWAMAVFHESGVRTVEVEVIAGNPALRFYERCGFQMNAHLLWRRDP